MKTDRNILIAFLLNLTFAIFELVGGVFTHSVAIMSDAVHDVGDAMSIGLSYFLEKKSRREPDKKHTYGYLRYSVLGGLITTVILLTGSVFVIVNAVDRIINPVQVNYNGMILFAVIGVVVNFLAAYFTHRGDSINQKAVNLHMLEDVLGWAIVLVGAIVMKFTDFVLIDPIMSICVAVFILINAVKNLKKIFDLFVVKTPDGISVDELRHHLCENKEIKDVHHIHIWSMDGYKNYATMHVVSDGTPHQIKHMVREELKNHGISHVTIELENIGEHCHEKICELEFTQSAHHHHHH